ncbi:exosortase/archaeosortase family protein [Nitrospira sp. BLG_1]|uniref:exosortase/archaeosortase family protein n=1 Tax=Nitrospira sp. BLG_1 TaxID=3395883 RepID=UPI0039BC437A
MKEPHSDKNGLSLGHQAASSVVLPDLELLSHPLPWRQGQRNALALLAFAGLCAWFWAPLVKLFTLTLENTHFDYVLLIPALTCYLLFMNRTTILTSHAWSPTVGLLVMAGGSVCYWFAIGQDWTQDRLAVEILTFVVMCWGLFLFGFGVGCFRKDLFALVMLLFMVPLPTVFLDAITNFLQRSSADAVDVLFLILDIPVVRERFIFTLSNFSIFISEECSGVRSFLALIITSLVAGHWFLTSGWSKTALVVVVVPLAIIKNAFRIVGLALLANYVDPIFITDSALHRSGGIPLFLFSLVVLFSIVLILRRYERRPDSMMIQ